MEGERERDKAGIKSKIAREVQAQHEGSKVRRQAKN